MYSESVTAKNIDQLISRGLKIRRRSIDEAKDIAAKLESRLLDKNGNRQLSSAEKAHILSESAICKHDFKYWAERYGYLRLDGSEGGGIAPIRFWESQLISLRATGKREEEIWEEYDKYGITAGILQVDHKVRQVGRTSITRLQLIHRMIFYRGYRCLSATLGSPNDSYKLEIYDKDKIIVDNLPFWMRPTLLYDVKGESIEFEQQKSRMLYTDSQQQAGIGTGAQFDGHHVTEAALWRNLKRLELEFLPAVPRSPYTLGVWESTANGRNDDWHEFTEAVRRKDRGYENWIYCFTPWYLLKKYRAPAPDSWTPLDITLKHAELVAATSPEFNEGVAIHPTREQLYWWESEREKARSGRTLAIFYTSYPAIPEESFQHSNPSGLPEETMEWINSTASLPGMPYHVVL